MTSRWEIFPDDLNATADFYVRVLGFEITKNERAAETPYLSLRCGEARIGALQREPQNEVDAGRPPVGVELVLDVDDLEAIHERVLAAGWSLIEGVTERPWRQTDFRIVDPSGYYLRITTR